MNEKWDMIVIGAGPAGLACAIYARRAELNVLVIEKGCLVNSIYHYPVNMTFFTTAELLEIGDVPFVVSTEKPKKWDALKYYRRVAEFYALPIRDFEVVSKIEGKDLDFSVTTQDGFQTERTYHCRKVVFATGYFDNPNLLGVAGEDLPKVNHYYTDPHPYYGKEVAVVGGKNSAAIAALELFRSGAHVTLIHRRKSLGREIKYWILPDINNRIQSGQIRTFFSSSVKEIRRRELVISTPKGEQVLENDFVFALTGYHPDPTLMQQMGVEIDPTTYVPRHDPETLETNVPGVYLAGSIISGKMTNRVFIENGRFHGERIVPHIQGSLAE
jgi:thioredoxin reductase (NADPH)